MRITRITTLEQLASLVSDWNRLAGDVPFRKCEWLHTWWQHYGVSRSLYVLVVRDESDHVVGIAPWYIERTALSGNVVQMLGSGEVCSDYLTVFATPEHRPEVARTIAEWLGRHHATDSEHHWDLVELKAATAADANIAAVARACSDHNFRVRSQPGPAFWRLDLPSTWEAYLAMLSHSHRKQLRRLDRRMFVSGRARVHHVRTRDDLVRAWPIFKYLHQLRRHSRSQRGCFESASFEAFLGDAVERLLSSAVLRLDILELDGRPVAAELDFASERIIYAYQSGMDPTRLADEPGRVLQMAVIQRAIREGRTAIDFLRGDEPYKAHWRATRRASVEVRIAPARMATALRNGIFDASAGVKQWIKTGLTTAGFHP